MNDISFCEYILLNQLPPEKKEGHLKHIMHEMHLLIQNRARYDIDKTSLDFFQNIK